MRTKELVMKFYIDGKEVSVRVQMLDQYGHELPNPIAVMTYEGVPKSPYEIQVTKR